MGLVIGRFELASALCGAALLIGGCSESGKEAKAPSNEAAARAAEAKGAGTYQAGAPAPAQQAPVRDPKAIEALRRMSEFLRAQSQFAVYSNTTREEVLANGQKIQSLERVDLKVRRPDRFLVEVDSNGDRHQLFYDGETMTLFEARSGYYAQGQAPPTIDQTVQRAQNRLGIHFPLVDLFYFGTAEGDEKTLLSAVYVGPSQVNGVDSEQYAYRRTDADFQVWIEKGDRPLPRRVSVIAKNEPSAPEYTADYTWNLAPSFPDNVFSFVPPEGAKRLEFDEPAP